MELTEFSRTSKVKVSIYNSQHLARLLALRELFSDFKAFSMKVVVTSYVFVLCLAVVMATFINEIHYDNAGTDVNEAVEIAARAGTSLFGWKLVFYNGNFNVRRVYFTLPLSGVITDLSNGFGFKTFFLSQIENGSPDGIALVNPANEVTEFLSYEGIFTALDGPAAGMTSVDIGVSEGSSALSTNSLQRTGTGNKASEFTWAGPLPATFGSINIGQAFL